MELEASDQIVGSGEAGRGEELSRFVIRSDRDECQGVMINDVASGQSGFNFAFQSLPEAALIILSND